MAGSTLAAWIPSSMKAPLASIMRPTVRFHVRHVPLPWGKRKAYELFDRFISWRPYRTRVRTRFGDLMELTLPDLISGTIYMTGRWEPAITAYIRGQLQPGDIFVDVGANIGYYSLLASRIVGPAGEVFAVEASPANFASLVGNIALNSAANIRAIHAAASDGPGEVPIFLGPEGNKGHATMIESLAAREGLALEAKVHADRIDRLIDPGTLRRARLIKIDVEGAERIVLAPLLSSLADFDRRTEWLLELSPDFSAGGQSDVDEIFGAFTAGGYRAYSIPNRYESSFFLSSGAEDLCLTRLHEPPREGLSDVLMSRARD